jgi:hypothetical protein
MKNTLIDYKLLYYKQKLIKDQSKLSKLVITINNLSNSDLNSEDKNHIKNSDKLLSAKIKKIETEGDISKNNTIINRLTSLSQAPKLFIQSLF